MKVRSEEEGMNGLNIEEMIARYGDDILRLCLLYLGDRQLAEDAFRRHLSRRGRAAMPSGERAAKKLGYPASRSTPAGTCCAAAGSA